MLTTRIITNIYNIYVCFLIQGLNSSTDEKGTSALKARDMDDSLGGAAVQVGSYIYIGGGDIGSVVCYLLVMEKY